MRLVFIYGPPAVGKLTVAEALAARTGYKVFHNHLTVDLAHAFFEFGSEPFGRYVTHLGVAAFETAAREGVPGVIFTFVSALGSDDEFVQNVQRIVEAHDGKVHFVQLTCDRALLEKRVLAESRQKFRKIKDIALLRDILDRHELFQPIPFVDNLSIDTTVVSPDGAAQHIAAHYSLNEQASA